MSTSACRLAKVGSRAGHSGHNSLASFLGGFEERRAWRWWGMCRGWPSFSTPPHIDPQLWSRAGREPSPGTAQSLISIDETLAAKRRQRIDLDQELWRWAPPTMASGVSVFPGVRAVSPAPSSSGAPAASDQSGRRAGSAWLTLNLSEVKGPRFVLPARRQPTWPATPSSWQGFPHPAGPG